MQALITYFFQFILIALASWQIGKFFKSKGLPVITGYLFTGVVAGPFVLGVGTEEMGHALFFLEELSLGFIAFAAGSELYLPELRSRFRSIGWITAGIVVLTFGLITTAVFLLASAIPFMQEMSTNTRLAVALLAGAIMTARSPSSAIAIVNELRAKGPYTQTILGVTVVSDVVVITIFAVTASLASVLLTDQGIEIGFFLLLLLELSLAGVVGYLLYHVICAILALEVGQSVKAFLIVMAGYGTFVLLHFVREYTHDVLPFEIFIEPLLVCLTASFLVNNYGKRRMEFTKILHDTGPFVYVLFFTLVGALLELPVFLQTWPIALALFLVRLIAIIGGSFAGGLIAREPMARNRLFWMSLVTQAGVALGLAEETASEFTQIDSGFVTMIISIVVVNEIVGPILFKRGINWIGESHSRAEHGEFDGVRDVIIFGLTPRSVQLAHQLQQHNWQVKIATRNEARKEELDQADVRVQLVAQWDLATLHELDMDNADSVVALMSDEENYELCELVYEHFGTETVVVQLNNRENAARFHELGVLIVEPQTAVVSLLEHFVRSPVGVSMLLGMDGGQDVVDIEVRNPDIHGLTLRDLRLPFDVLILSVSRDHHTIISHGYTRLHLGDKVTMLGSAEKLEEVMRRFDA
jgi:Trk K+ transport system NAD-binding subunit/Kef-type K+ transport system membrane component KefB